ncbi:MAG TPA: hypothetical protein VF763_11975 [Candidatus Limnocylindrales bacterium]
MWDQDLASGTKRQVSPNGIFCDLAAILGGRVVLTCAGEDGMTGDLWRGRFTPYLVLVSPGSGPSLVTSIAPLASIVASGGEIVARADNGHAFAFAFARP